MNSFLSRIAASVGLTATTTPVVDTPFDIAGVVLTKTLPTVRYTYMNAAAVVMPELDQTIGDYLAANAVANGKTIRPEALFQVNGEVVVRSMTFAEIEAKFGAIADTVISVPDAQRAAGEQG